ncbi:MAG: hypothetical protein M0R37_03835 [Bacteroidales bacterium]|nr:hypothetical protein [Bacteroidales bacterium]
MNKISHYRLSISRKFPKTHPRAGEQTYFKEKIDNAIGETQSCNVVIHTECGEVEIWPKIHTIRANYPLWEKRMKKVQAGKAVIELYYWQGKPRKSKQIVFATLDKDSGCGLQKLDCSEDYLYSVKIDDRFSAIDTDVIAKNDGLSYRDWENWFEKYDLSKPLAIIQFTSFWY